MVLVHQELRPPAGELSVAENVLLGREPAARLPGFLGRRALLGEQGLPVLYPGLLSVRAWIRPPRSSG